MQNYADANDITRIELFDKLMPSNFVTWVASIDEFRNIYLELKAKVKSEAESERPRECMDSGPRFRRAVITTSRQIGKNVLDDDETVLIKRRTNSNTNSNPNTNF